MNLDNFIITKTKRREERGDLAKKKQQLLSKHRAAADGVCCTAIGVLVCIKTANMTWIWVVRGAAIYCNLRFFFYLCNCNTQSVKVVEKPQNLSKDHGSMQTLHWHMERVNKIDMRLIWQTRCTATHCNQSYSISTTHNRRTKIEQQHIAILQYSLLVWHASNSGKIVG